ncbi:MAG TPA: hypothetical protein VJH96_02800 [Patescibacteria group bacterium]|nr:hypothetical protein [Patescibacteria group bacterium]
MSKNFFIIIIVIVVLIGGYMVFSKKTTSPETTTPSVATQESTDSTTEQTGVVAENGIIQEKVIIKYTDQGFEPKSLTVKVGTPVTFTNMSAKSMWVASAPHPAHTDLPGFDALKAMGKGESYTFTFSALGTWKYHDHMSPSDFGSIVVE